jgi:hypothetical protein
MTPHWAASVRGDNDWTRPLTGLLCSSSEREQDYTKSTGLPIAAAYLEESAVDIGR